MKRTATLKITTMREVVLILVCMFIITGCTQRTSRIDVDEPYVVSGAYHDDSEDAGRISGDRPDGAGLSTRLLVDEARALACMGAVKFKDGDLDEAYANLEAALMNLHLADLPDDMQTIAFFQPYLPEKCNSVDLKRAYESLKDTRNRTDLFPEDIPDPVDAFSPADRLFIEMEIRRFMEILGERCDRDDEMEVFVEEVEKFINFFLTTRRGWVERSYYRMMKYHQTVEEIMSEKRMPVELVYLAFIESGFMYRATSHANARGVWQFINSTGRNYGLRIAGGVDERLDPIKSTIAAREYLLDLVAIFGSESFLLAMASYNAGEGRVQRCLRRLEDPFSDRSFWQIRSCLHRETQEYIPRIIAAGIICENPKRFGIDLPTAEELFSERDVVIFPDRVRLSDVAAIAGVTVAELRELNPDLPSGGAWTPVTNMHLWVPDESAEMFKVALHTMETAPEVMETYHIVRSGETLSSIGRRYRVPYRQIAVWNNIRSPYRIRAGQRLLIQAPGTAAEKQTATTPVAESPDPTPAQTTGATIIYTVKKGNYLAGIGALFGVSARDVMSWNGLRRATIFPGQRLTIQPAFSVQEIRHRVTSGETLTGIARRYKVSIDAILFANGMSERPLRIGETLIIYKRQ
jgi:membrane-bound lytic murein transglycosylase D